MQVKLAELINNYYSGGEVKRELSSKVSSKNVTSLVENQIDIRNGMSNDFIYLPPVKSADFFFLNFIVHTA